MAFLFAKIWRYHVPKYSVTTCQSMALPRAKVWRYHAPRYGVTTCQSMALPPAKVWRCHQPKYGVTTSQSMALRLTKVWRYDPPQNFPIKPLKTIDFKIFSVESDDVEIFAWSRKFVPTKFLPIRSEYGDTSTKIWHQPSINMALPLPKYGVTILYQFILTKTFGSVQRLA